MSKLSMGVSLGVLFIGLLTIPFFEEVHNVALYYTLALLLILPIIIYRVFWFEKIDGRFYKRWSKARMQGFWINVLREGVRSFVVMVVVVCISLFMARGLTPLEILSALSTSIVVLLVMLSFIGGVLACYDNDKRYNRLLLKNKKD